ncbi:MAG TPA: FKBP-type peptidyl-prolyl cis-trans isomerase N-terminal domain-containing protein [Candidatus Acidoferrum sp.]|nr:FKBP-type peptidyl-prolyl cis-trans isomerase N-terminal domain-containing protein [Candidatus Acidoferrum sp.]
MKKMTRFLILALCAAGLAGCASQSKPAAAANPAPAAPPAPVVTETNLLSTEKERNSYAVGMTLGRNFQMQGLEVDLDLLARAIKDSMAGGPTLLTPQEMQETLGKLQSTLMMKAQKMREAVGVTNKALSEAFFATNKTNPDVVTLPSGLQYVVITNGSGPAPASNDIVRVTYRAMLLDGTVFDDTLGRPRSASMNSITPGEAEALIHMNVGSKWKVFIPPNLGFGEMGSGRYRVMPNSTLIYEIELVDVEHPKPPEPLTSDIVKVPSLEEMKKGAKVEIIKAEDAAKMSSESASPATNAPATNAPAK